MPQQGTAVWHPESPRHLSLVLPLMPHNPALSKSQPSQRTLLNEAVVIRGQKELGSTLMEQH